MKKIAFVGAPSSGKTTLAANVFVTLKCRGLKVELVHEWIRYDIQLSGVMKSIWEQYRTYQHQKELEDSVPKEIEYVIADGGLLSQYFYAVQYCDPRDPRQRLVLQDMYKFMIDNLYLNRYDMVFYLPLMASSLQPDKFNDGTRFQDNDEIIALDDHMNLVFNKIHKTDRIYRVDSEPDQRLAEVMKHIDAYQPRKMPSNEIHQRHVPLPGPRITVFNDGGKHA